MIIKEEVTLRNWMSGDEKQLAEQGNNPKIAKNLIDTFPNPYTLNEAKKWIKLNKDPKAKNFAIVVNNKIAGGTGYSIKNGDKAHVAVIGYWLGEDYWGRGIGTKVANMIVKHIFKNKKIRRIEAKVYTWNPGSKRVLEKVGFSFEGTLRMNTLKDGKIVDEWSLSIVR
jgi:[ribosomal protein S5]-alanine N-acetyltransferase